MTASLITRLNNGETVRTAFVTCGVCDNSWFVVGLPEMQPAFCTYCGTRFMVYTDSNGVMRNLAGQPIQEGETRCS